MPITRTYEGIDFINYLAGFTVNNGLTNTALESPTSNFNFVISSSGTNTPFSGNLVDDVEFVYDASGDLDFDAFPAIPDNALIVGVEVRIDVSLTATANSDSTNTTFSTPCSAGGTIKGQVFIPDLDNPGDFIELTDLSINEVDYNVGLGPQSASASHVDHYTNVQTFDYSGDPITKAALEAQFTSWLVRLSTGVPFTGTWTARANLTTGGSFTGSTSEVIGFSFDGIRVTVSYNSGPEMHITTNPADGSDIKPGERITVTDDDHKLDLSEFTYAMIINGRVIPLEPQETDEEWEIYLEFPWPPDDECAACWDLCTICDSCGPSCDADLEGRDCTDCIAACLECIKLCFEGMGLYEECLGEGEGPGPGILIMGTQFSGSVRLGTFTILEAEASGIYRFVTGKTNDTVYTPARDGTTYDVRIPNPSGKTGFFRS